jgi:hypothetical protein
MKGRAFVRLSLCIRHPHGAVRGHWVRDAKDDLDRSGKIWLRKIPNPLGSITHDDFLFRPAPAAIPGFQVDALAKFFSRLDGAGVSCGTRVADRVAFLVPGGLREVWTQIVGA